MNKYLKLILTTLFIAMMMTSINAKTVNLTDFGAVADDGIDDSESFNNALADLAGSGGGTLILPSGDIDMNDRVRVSLNNANYQITGDSGTVIRLHGHQGMDFFDFEDATQFDIKNVVFAGEASDGFDAATLISFKSVKHATISKSTFFNIGATVAIIDFENAILSVEDTMFLGSGATDSTIRSSSSLGLSISNSVFENSGEFRGQNGNKIDSIPQMAWIHVANPDAEGVTAKSGHIRIKDSKFGSDALYTFCIENQGSAQLSGVTATINPTKLARGVFARNIAHLDVSSTSFSGNGRGRYAFSLKGNTYLLASGLILYGGAVIGDLEGASERNIVHCVGCTVSPLRRR
jgi:hypothetical protein